MRLDIPRLLVAGSGSGSGKTTLSCALLLAFKRRGLCLAAFKCGPDYIDPMFHSRVLGVKSRNLDIFMCGEAGVKALLAENAAGHGFALIEGVMGLYDGQGSGEYGSSNHLSLLTDTPALLVLNPRGQSLSLAAQLHGFLKFLPNNIKGVILNQTSEKMYPFYKEMLESRLGVKVYGYLPPMPEAGFDSRHLGLVTPDEMCGIEAKLGLLADACEKGVDMDGLAELARSAPGLAYAAPEVEEGQRFNGLKIAVAYDKAFCFYYEDNFDLLRKMGASLEFFSPLEEPVLPAGVSGLILGGGYPEEHAAALSRNKSMLQSIRRAGEKGLPIFAECGGFMYLCRSLTDKSGESHDMAGLLDVCCHMSTRLGPFGYVTLKAVQDNFLCESGAEFRAHEFHYSLSDDNGAAFTATKATGASWPCIHASSAGDHKRIFAGYPHFHFRGNEALAAGFLEACAAYAPGAVNG